jgi:replicative DNA helicase
VENRERKKPRLSDLRESGAIEQDADQVWMLHRPCMYQEVTDVSYDESAAELYIRKNRIGPVGKVDLEFRKDTMQFKSKVVEYATDFN